MSETVNHVHSWESPDEARVRVKLTKNTKGFTWELSISGKDSFGELIEEVREANERMQIEFTVEE